MIELEKLNFENKVLLDKILEWRNNIDTRLNSKNSNIITEEIFMKILAKYKECEINPLMIKINEKYIGIITFVSNEDKISIGINIDPDYRGKSYGNLAIEYFKNNFSKYVNTLTPIYAEVKKTNIASNKLFSKYFSCEYETEEYKLYSIKQ